MMFTVCAIIFAIILTTLLFTLYQKATNAVCKSTKKLNGKTVIVTGGTSGIGLEIAQDIARRNARLIIACPDEKEGKEAKRIIEEITGNETVTFKSLDLASLESVRRFAADILKTEHRLDILMNNAGVGGPEHDLTKDGMNFLMQVNYFGHFLLTILLLPLLKKTGTESEPSRIVNTTSIAHLTASTDIKNYNKTNYWSKFRVYYNSKLSLLLFSHELSKKLNGSHVVINSAHPGSVGTRIYQGFLNHILGNIFGAFLFITCKTPKEGAQTCLHVALDNEAGRVTGQYFTNCKLVRTRDAAYDDKLSKLLWEESVRLVRISDSELEKCLQ